MQQQLAGRLMTDTFTRWHHVAC